MLNTHIHTHTYYTTHNPEIGKPKTWIPEFQLRGQYDYEEAATF